MLLALRALRWRRGGEEVGVHYAWSPLQTRRLQPQSSWGAAGEDPTWPGLGQEAQDMAESDHPFST